MLPAKGSDQTGIPTRFSCDAALISQHISAVWPKPSLSAQVANRSWLSKDSVEIRRLLEEFLKKKVFLQQCSSGKWQIRAFNVCLKNSWLSLQYPSLELNCKDTQAYLSLYESLLFSILLRYTPNCWHVKSHLSGRWDKAVWQVEPTCFKKHNF